MAAHLPRLLQVHGVPLATALLFAGLVGPAQVAGRLLEYGLLRNIHPLVSARVAGGMHTLGAVVFLFFGVPAGAVFTVLHGAGNGVLTIAKGTLPLVPFGVKDYGARQGLLMVPARFAQALSPWLFGLAIDRFGRAPCSFPPRWAAWAWWPCCCCMARAWHGPGPPDSAYPQTSHFCKNCACPMAESNW